MISADVSAGDGRGGGVADDGDAAEGSLVVADGGERQELVSGGRADVAEFEAISDHGCCSFPCRSRD